MQVQATTDSKHGKPVAASLLNRNFSASRLNHAYVGDITYIHTREGSLYLAVFIGPVFALCSGLVDEQPNDRRAGL